MDRRRSIGHYEEIGLNPSFRDNEGALLRALLQSTEYGILVSGLDRQDIIANKRLGELFRMPPQRIVETDPDAVRADARTRVRDPQTFDEFLCRAYEDPYFADDDEIELIGEPTVVLRRTTGPVIGTDGTPVARLWTFVDITPTKRMQEQVEAQLSDAVAELQRTQQRMVDLEKLHVAGTLAVSVAHDIRNILTVLQMELDAIDSSVSTPLSEQLNRFSALTHRLLAFARPSVLEMRPISVCDVLKRIIPILVGQAQVNAVEIETDFPEGLPPVDADANQLDHLFVNLCQNAIQAMAVDGGKLTLSVRKNEKWVEAAVCDTGSGIAPEILPHLFDPFFTTRATGTGLGLFSCKRIVEDHGGQISVISRPGHGARFSVLLAARPEYY